MNTEKPTEATFGESRSMTCYAIQSPTEGKNMSMNPLKIDMEATAKAAAIFHEMKKLKDAKQAKTEIKTVFVRLGRNDPCNCGSGRKYKKCCLPRCEP